MVWPSFTNHSSFVCCSLLDHWLCSYVHSSTIQPPLLGHKTNRIFSVLLWLGPLVQKVRKGPYFNLSVSSFGVFVENKEKAVVVYFILRWPCWCYHCVFLPYCVGIWVGNQLFKYWFGDGWKGVFIDIVFSSLIFWSICKSDEYLSPYVQPFRGCVIELRFQDQLYDIW